MGSVRCRCGSVIRNTPDYGPEWLRGISHDDLDRLTESLKDDLADLAPITVDAVTSKVGINLIHHSQCLVRCPDCDRLMIWWGDGKVATFYALEAEPPPNDPPS